MENKKVKHIKVVSTGVKCHFDLLKVFIYVK